MTSKESAPPAPAQVRIADPGDDYDPHQHRELADPTNNWETLIHLVKSSLGTGILAMPQAYARAGLVTGIVSTVIAAIVVTHCLHILVRSQYYACKRRRVPLLNYPESMAEALTAGPERFRRMGRPAAIAVDIFLVVFQLGICCVYIVFIADNIKKVIDPHYILPVEVHMVFIMIPLVCFNLIPTLKLLTPFSLLANVLTLVGLAIIVYYLMSEKRPKIVEDEPLDLWGTITTFPLFFGTVLFSLTAVGVVVALENNMKTPKAFGTPFGVLNTGMTIIVILYVWIGAIGYLFCLSECSDSITLDLPAGILTTSVIVMFAVAIFISYGLHCFVPVQVVWLGYVRPRLVAKSASPRTLLIAEYVLRIVLCLLTFILAVAVPRLGLFISLFGALCLSALGLCFPAVMEACLAWGTTGRRAMLQRVKDALLIVIGLLGLTVGTYTALLAIVRSFQYEGVKTSPTEKVLSPGGGSPSRAGATRLGEHNHPLVWPWHP